MLEPFDRPSRVLDWATRTFGAIALDPSERAMRFVEEAIEVAHAVGVQAETMKVIVDRVYAREPGKVPRELGQALMCLEILAKVMRVDIDREAYDEFARVQSVPQEEWDRRHAAKAALGMALTSGECAP